LIAALSAAGLPSDRFIFEGFLPAKAAGRRAPGAGQGRAAHLIFYEAPHRILECLQDMEAVFGGERPALLAREITKTFETLKGLPLAELRAFVQATAISSAASAWCWWRLDAPEDEQAISAEAQRVLDLLLASCRSSVRRRWRRKSPGCARTCCINWRWKNSATDGKLILFVVSLVLERRCR
jgi:16S rRNA (cytidine1402-2'-O)-methyltransferase